VGAYDKVSVTVPAGTTTAPPVHVQPDDKIERIKFLYIKSDIYSKAAPKTLTYKTTETGKPIRLDHSQILIGSSLIALLDEAKNFTINNQCDEDAHIDILVGRDVS